MPANTRQLLIERVAEVARRAAAREGIQVWDVEVLGSGPARTVRIYIDKPGGVSHADCELISQQAGTVFDVEDVIPGGSYHLEVSSPGVERRLSRIEHYALCKGQKVKLSLKHPGGGQKRVEGVIQEVEGETIVVDAGGVQPFNLRLDEIEKANLKFEW